MAFFPPFPTHGLNSESTLSELIKLMLISCSGTDDSESVNPEFRIKLSLINQLSKIEITMIKQGERHKEHTLSHLRDTSPFRVMPTRPERETH